MYKTLNKFVDIDKLKSSITDAGLSTSLGRWKDTAIEVKREKENNIYNLYLIYKGIPKEELNADKVILFIDSVLELIETLDEQNLLVTAEALDCKKL